MFQLYLLAQLPYLWSEQMVETLAKADVPALLTCTAPLLVV